MSPIPEADWKVFKQLHPVAMERLCQRMVEEMQRAAADTSKTAHERFHDVGDLLKEGRQELRVGFDGYSRSRCIEQILFMHTRDLITEEESARFTPETRKWIASTRASWRLYEEQVAKRA